MAGEPHLDTDDIAVGIDLGSREHAVVVLDTAGRRLTRFRVPHSNEGFAELLQRTAPARFGRSTGRAVFAFEATGHFWEAVAHYLAEHGHRYVLVNPLATFRVREARQMGRDKRDATDAEQIADLLRTGVVTKTQLEAPPYVELRRTWGEFDRLRRERARLKTLLKHQLYAVFPEFVRVWKDLFAPGPLAVLRLGLTPGEIAVLTPAEFTHRVTMARDGRRLWKPKLVQVHRWAQRTVAPPQGMTATVREITRAVVRVDLLGQQLAALEGELRAQLTAFPEAQFLATIPGVGWATVAGLIAQIGSITKYRHGRQLIKLAGLNPGRRESGTLAGRTMMTRRGRADLRTIVYMATLSGLQHNPRLRAHFDRLRQRPHRPLATMPAYGACMTKFLLYAFAVMKHRVPFDPTHPGRLPRKEAA